MSQQTISTIFGLMVVEYLGVLLSVLADLVSGVRKSRREGRKCSSRGFRRTVSKLASYYLSLFCVSVVDIMAMAAIVTLDGALPIGRMPVFPYLTTLGALSLALIEVKSIAENSPHATDLLNAVKYTLSLFKSTFKGK